MVLDLSLQGCQSVSSAKQQEQHKQQKGKLLLYMDVHGQTRHCSTTQALPDRVPQL